MDRETALWYPHFGRHLEEYQALVGRELVQVIDELRAEADEHEEGTVHWFDEAKGYGFITAYDSRDVFVHWKGIAGEGFRSLEAGQRVRFKRRVGSRSVEAFDVTPQDPPATLP